MYVTSNGRLLVVIPVDKIEIWIVELLLVLAVSCLECILPSLIFPEMINQAPIPVGSFHHPLTETPHGSLWFIYSLAVKDDKLNLSTTEVVLDVIG